MITFSKFLATIKTDAPIALDMDSLVREEPDEQELRKIFGELEFRTLIDRVLGKGNTSAPTTGQSAAGTPDLLPELCLHSRKPAPPPTPYPSKAICLPKLRTRGRALRKKRI